MNTRDFAKYILDECLNEIQRMATYVDTDTSPRLIPVSFKMHTMAYDYLMKGEY